MLKPLFGRFTGELAPLVGADEVGKAVEDFYVTYSGFFTRSLRSIIVSWVIDPCGVVEECLLSMEKREVLERAQSSASEVAEDWKSFEIMRFSHLQESPATSALPNDDCAPLECVSDARVRS